MSGFPFQVCARERVAMTSVQAAEDPDQSGKAEQKPRPAAEQQQTDDDKHEPDDAHGIAFQ